MLACVTLALLLYTATASAETVLRRGITAEPGTLDPQSGDSIYQLRLVADLFEGLTAIAPGGRVVPGQAESWIVSPDGLVWTFTLRPGLVWSNGAPLSAEDFVYSFRRLVDPAQALRLAFLAEPIRRAHALLAGDETDLTRLGVEAPDLRTLRLTLEAPDPALPEILAQLAPVYRPALDAAGRDAFKPGHIIGNGAYRLVEWQKGTRLVAERNPLYRDAASVAIDRVEYYPVEAVAEEFKRYRAGQIDLTSDVPGDELELIRRAFADQLKTSPSFGLFYIGFNSRRPPFKDNAKLREALTLAIDRAALTDTLLRNGTVPAYGWIPPGIPGYRGAGYPGAALSQAEREDSARRAYAEAGYAPDHPLVLELAYNSSDVNRRQMIAIAAMWHRVLGVETDLRGMELRSLLDLRQQGVGAQAFRAGFAAPYVDPLPLLQLLQSGGRYNDLGYADPAFDAALAKADSLPSSQARLDGLAGAEAIGLADFPAAPVYFLAQQRLIKPYVTGWQPSPRDTFRSQDLAITPH